MIKVLIVEDQQILLDTFTSAMHNYEDIRVVAAIADAGAADLACRMWHPDCVLMDICADGDILGIYATARIKKADPAIKVILMTGFPELNFLERGKEAGADSFLYKTSSMEEFVECIRATMAGVHRYPDVSRNTMTFGAAQCFLTEKDVVRHELVQRIVKAYAEYENKKGKGKPAAKPAGKRLPTRRKEGK